MTTIYECLAHGHRGSDVSVACPECYASQKAAAGSDRRVLRFRKADGTARAEPSPRPMRVPPAPPPAVEPPAPMTPDAAAMVPVLCGPTLPRVAGVDPGSHWFAITIGEGTAAPLRYVDHLVIEVGHLVPLRKPKTIQRADGSTRTITHRRVIDDLDVEKALTAALTFLVLHGVERVVLERATFFMGGDAGPGASGARAASLLRAQWLGGELAGALRAAHVSDGSGTLRLLVPRVETVSSKVWRGHARKLPFGDHPSHGFVGDPAQCGCGAYPVEPGIAHRPCPLTDAGALLAWQEAVCLAFGGTLPVMLNEHALDASGCALYSVRQPSPPAQRPRASATPGVEGAIPASHSHPARRAAALARQAALSCPCPPTRPRLSVHPVLTCPLRLSSNAARSAAMTGNANARPKP